MTKHTRSPSPQSSSFLTEAPQHHVRPSLITNCTSATNLSNKPPQQTPALHNDLLRNPPTRKNHKSTKQHEKREKKVQQPSGNTPSLPGFSFKSKPASLNSCSSRRYTQKIDGFFPFCSVLHDEQHDAEAHEHGHANLEKKKP